MTKKALLLQYSCRASGACLMFRRHSRLEMVSSRAIKGVFACSSKKSIYTRMNLVSVANLHTVLRETGGGMGALYVRFNSRDTNGHAEERSEDAIGR